MDGALLGVAVGSALGTIVGRLLGTVLGSNVVVVVDTVLSSCVRLDGVVGVQLGRLDGSALVDGSFVDGAVLLGTVDGSKLKEGIWDTEGAKRCDGAVVVCAVLTKIGALVCWLGVEGLFVVDCVGASVPRVGYNVGSSVGRFDGCALGKLLGNDEVEGVEDGIMDGNDDELGSAEGHVEGCCVVVDDSSAARLTEEDLRDLDPAVLLLLAVGGV